jgi:hypothetical protein
MARDVHEPHMKSQYKLAPMENKTPPFLHASRAERTKGPIPAKQDETGKVASLI